MTPTPNDTMARTGSANSTDDEAVERDLDGILRGSRVLTSVIAGSLARADDVVTILQLRVLVLAATRPGTTATDVAEAIGVHVSSASRTVDRLVASGLLERQESTEDRRRLELVPTREGVRLLDAVMEDRRRELRQMLERMPDRDRRSLTRGMEALAEAAGEPPFPSPLIP